MSRNPGAAGALAYPAAPEHLLQSASKSAALLSQIDAAKPKLKSQGHSASSSRLAGFYLRLAFVDAVRLERLLRVLPNAEPGDLTP